MPTDKPTIAALLCGLTLIAGCTTTTPGTAVQSSPVGGLFEPCTIPDDALAAAGLDPATVSVGFVGEQFTHAKLCSWDGPWYNIGIFGMTDTIEQIRAHPRYTGFHDVPIDDRNAVLFRMSYDPRDSVCLIGYTTRRGTVLFHAMRNPLVDEGGDTCEAVTATAHALNRHIPS